MLKKRNKLLTATVSVFALAGLAMGLGGCSSPAPETSTTTSATTSTTEPATDPVIDLTDWKLKLVNGENPLPAEFAVETAVVEDGYYLDARAVDALKEMLRDARAQGLSPIICSAYRSIERQQELYERKIGQWQDKGYSYEEAKIEAGKIVAIPGTSEHNLGLAVDIVATSYQILDEKQADTAEQEWLMANCHKYGFILRYPKEKQEITNIIYEPWHYRYVGVDAAAEIMNKGICLEEYLGKA